MKIVKNIVGHIFATYLLLMFIITMLVIIIPVWLITFLPEPKRAKGIHIAFRIWMGLYLPIIGCPVFRKGKENFKKGENYVVVINHNSLMDIPVSAPWVPVPTRTLGKIEFARVPLFGIIYKSGTILLDRESRKSKLESLKEMLYTLDLGLSLCIYPEGTRNKTGNPPIQPFVDGAFNIAIKAQKSIIPCLIFNTRKILPAEKQFWALPHVIKIHFLEPIPTKGLTLENVTTLSEKVHRIMEEYYTTHINN